MKRKNARMREIVICKVSSFPDPGRKVVELDGTEVGVFCRNGKFTAFENICPHMGGPVCQGKINPRVQEMIAEDRRAWGWRSLRNRSMSPVPGMAMNSTSKPANIRAIRGCGCGRSR
jgi:hypothetical protein